MKVFRTILGLLLSVWAFLPASLYSQTFLFWDTNGSGSGATNGTTADGIWDVGQTLNWSVNSSGVTGTRTWAQASRAVFAAGTNATGSSFVEIVGAPEIAGFIVEEGSWNFTGGTLRLFHLSPFDIPTGSTVSIHSSIQGMPGNVFEIRKTGGGDLALTSDLTGSVEMRINGGNLTFEGTGGAAPVITGVKDLLVGDLTDGNLSVVDGASFTTNNLSTFQVGARAGVSGILTVTGTQSTLVSNKPALDVGFDGTGTLNATEGGTVTANGGLRFGVNAAGVGHGLVTGNNSAVTVASGLDIGTFGDGTLTIADGGTVSVLGAGVVFGSLTGGTGVLHLNSGGVLATNGLRIGAGGTGTFNWAGGSLRASGPFTSAVPATVSGTTSTIDSNGFAVTLSGDLSGDGALTKTGGDTATLSGNNTYTGGTTLAGGTLQILGRHPAARRGGQHRLDSWQCGQ